MTTLASIAPVSIHSRAGHRETGARSLRPAVRASPRRNKGVVICEAADKDFACRVASLAAAIAVVAYEPLPAIAAFGQSTIELSNITYTVVEGREVVATIERDSRDRGKPDVFETYETRDGETRLSRREEDVDGDGSIDVISIYEDGKLVQRAISDEALSPL